MESPSASLQAELDASRAYHEGRTQGQTPADKGVISWFEREVVDTNLEGAVLIDGLLQGARLIRCCLDGVLAYDALAGHSVWDGSSLVDAEFRQASMVNASLRETVLDGARFAKVDLAGGVFSGARARGANFFKAWMPGANLAGVDLQGADLTRARLDGADLSGANLAGATLTSASINCSTKLAGCTGLDSARVDRLLIDGKVVEGDDARRELVARASGLPGVLRADDPDADEPQEG
ncbi:MAG: pentapeptide repeat-containing protein [Deltaproteobacteria bacterium]|nr:pentapeptide repeat-containing protein [Deltaproteobacteria bacterium]